MGTTAASSAPVGAPPTAVRVFGEGAKHCRRETCAPRFQLHCSRSGVGILLKLVLNLFPKLIARRWPIFQKRFCGQEPVAGQGSSTFDQGDYPLTTLEIRALPGMCGYCIAGPAAGRP